MQNKLRASSLFLNGLFMGQRFACLWLSCAMYSFSALYGDLFGNGRTLLSLLYLCHHLHAVIPTARTLVSSKRSMRWNDSSDCCPSHFLPGCGLHSSFPWTFLSPLW